MALIPTNPFAIKYGSGVVLLEDVYTPPVDPPPYRARSAGDDPHTSEFFMNVPIGSGITAVSTSDAKYTGSGTTSGYGLHDCIVGINNRDWTDPTYYVTESDPLSSGIRHHAFLPSGYLNVTNTGSMTGTPGALRKTYTSSNLRIPSGATWQSSNNRDRKVILVYTYDITITTTTYDTAGTSVTGTTTRFYPAGTLQIECHNWMRVTGQTYIWTTNLSKQNIFLSDTAYTEGAIASGIAMNGYVRAWEVAAAKAGDPFAIKHALKFGVPNDLLKLGPLWPARSQDSPDPPYAGPLPYGTHVYLPASFDVNAATSDPLARAFLWAMKLFGAYLLIRAGTSGAVMFFGIEPRNDGWNLTSTEINTVKNAMTAAVPSMRISANSNLTPGTGAGNYNTTTRQPIRGATDIAGGGTRITAGMGLDDFDNTTGLKLPLDPALYT